MQRTTLWATTAAPPPVPPAQVLATGVSLLWHDGQHVYWSVFVAWQEEGAGPCHTDYVPCRAPWGGPWSVDDCVVAVTAEIRDRYHRRFGLPRVTRSVPRDRAWWWHGDPLLEPLLRVVALGAPEW